MTHQSSQRLGWARGAEGGGRCLRVLVERVVTCHEESQQGSHPEGNVPRARTQGWPGKSPGAAMGCYPRGLVVRGKGRRVLSGPTRRLTS